MFDGYQGSQLHAVQRLLTTPIENQHDDRVPQSPRKAMLIRQLELVDPTGPPLCHEAADQSGGAAGHPAAQNCATAAGTWKT